MEKTSSKTLPSKPGFGGRLPFRKIAPNIVTMLALCAGVTSIRYSVQEDWVKAVICIFLAALFDGLDGRVVVNLSVLVSTAERVAAVFGKQIGRASCRERV